MERVESFLAVRAGAGGVSTKSGVVALICGLVVVMVSMQSFGAAAPFGGEGTTPKPEATSADLRIGFQ